MLRGISTFHGSRDAEPPVMLPEIISGGLLMSAKPFPYKNKFGILA